MDVEAIRERLVRRFGPSVAGWCDRVPALAERAAVRWGFTLGQPFQGGASSVALRCDWPDGTRAVLKLSPDRPLLMEQASMLRLFASSGRVPAVLGADPDAGMLVLEAIRPGTMADELPEPPSPRQWADVVASLHAVAIPAGPLRDLRARCDEAFARIGRRLTEPSIATHISQDTWNRAYQRCEKLLNTDRKPVLLHGDLHMGNVLDGGSSRGLMAIDPKVCVGDRCFDVVDYVLAGAGKEGVDTRCEQVAGESGIDADRLHAWCQVIAPMTLIGSLTYGNSKSALIELLTLTR